MQIGDYGLTTIKAQPLGFFVGLGLFLTGDASRYNHAFIMVGDDLAVEARPRGAGYVKPSVLYPDSVYSHLELTTLQRAAIADEAEQLSGRGYNWLDYPALALLRFGIRPDWVTKYVANKGRLICSQLVDEAHRLAGVHLFNDDRLSQDVTPGDLLYIGKVW